MVLSSDPKLEYALWFVLSDINSSSREADVESETSSISKFKNKVKDFGLGNKDYGSEGDEIVVPIRMSEEEYNDYFATDEATKEYLSSVSEPPGGRQAWLKGRMDEHNPKPRKMREAGSAGKASGGFYGPIGMTGAVGGGGA